MIGRFVDVHADLSRVEVRHAGHLVAAHDRVWARGMTITDPDHVAATKVLREQYQRPGRHRCARAISSIESLYVCGQGPDFALFRRLDSPRRRIDRVHACGQNPTGAGEHLDDGAVDEDPRGRAAGRVVECV